MHLLIILKNKNDLNYNTDVSYVKFDCLKTLQILKNYLFTTIFMFDA